MSYLSLSLSLYLSLSLSLYIYIYICFLIYSSKRGAVETGCSGLHYGTGCLIISYYSHPLHPPPTAPARNEYPETASPPTSVEINITNTKTNDFNNITTNNNTSIMNNNDKYYPRNTS